MLPREKKFLPPKSPSFELHRLYIKVVRPLPNPAKENHQQDLTNLRQEGLWENSCKQSAAITRQAEKIFLEKTIVRVSFNGYLPLRKATAKLTKIII